MLQKTAGARRFGASRRGEPPDREPRPCRAAVPGGCDVWPRGKTPLAARGIDGSSVFFREIVLWTGGCHAGAVGRNFQDFPSVTMVPPKIVPFPSGLPENRSPAGHVASPQEFTAMKTDLIEKAARVIPNPPVLVNLVSRRVRQLNQGRAPLINPAAYGMRLGQGDIALLEIIEGKISAEFADAPAEPS